MRLNEFKRLPIADIPTRPPENNSFVAYRELRVMGIMYSRVHLRRLVQRELFPRPVMLSPNRQAWRRSDLLVWMESRPTAPMPTGAHAAA